MVLKILLSKILIMPKSVVLPDDFEKAYKYLNLFMSIPKENLPIMLSYAEWRFYDKRDAILNKGDVERHLNIVIRGLVRKFIIVNKVEQTLQLATEGHIFQSEISFFKQEPSLVMLQALEPTLILSIEFDKMEEAFAIIPEAERLGRLLLTRMYIKKQERRYLRASMSVRERFIDYIDKNPHMLQRIPQKYLASYLNIKPETFSRLKRLAMKKN